MTLLRRLLRRLRYPWIVFAAIGCSVQVSTDSTPEPCLPAGTVSTGFQCAVVCTGDGFALGSCFDQLECVVVQSDHYVNVVRVGGEGEPEFRVWTCEEYGL